MSTAAGDPTVPTPYLVVEYETSDSRSRLDAAVAAGK
jgi:hypothetical protein